MNTGPIPLIEEWFSDHDGDGEFAWHERTDAYSIIGPAGTEAHWLFTTKPACVLRAIGDKIISDRFVMIGGHGLPSADDLNWIARLVATGRLSFLGDLDPVDLLIYRWLQTQLHPLDVAHLGINDTFLGALAFEETEPRRIPLSASEREALRLLNRCFPELVETVGTQCAELLKSGWKLELEAFVTGGAARFAELILDATK
jgi:hypothetical protein